MASRAANLEAHAVPNAAGGLAGDAPYASRDIKLCISVFCRGGDCVCDTAHVCVLEMSKKERKEVTEHL